MARQHSHREGYDGTGTMAPDDVDRDVWPAGASDRCLCGHGQKRHVNACGLCLVPSCKLCLIFRPEATNG